MPLVIFLLVYFIYKDFNHPMSFFSLCLFQFEGFYFAVYLESLHGLIAQPICLWFLELARD